MYFKDILRRKRKETNKRQQDIAEYLGLSNVSYAQYEQGKTEPSIETIKKLAKLFNTTTDELLGINNNLINKQNELNNSYTEEDQEMLKIWQQLTLKNKWVIIGRALGVLEIQLKGEN